MGLRGIFEAILYFTIFAVVSSETQSPTTEIPRDFLFVQPRKFVLQTADKNKTRFTEEEKWLILQMHNSYRSLVLPPATDMRELVWDTDLEEYAWNHTQTCTGAHSAGTMLKKWGKSPPSWQTWRYMGENLYYRYAPQYSIEEALWMFWREGKDYDIFSGNCTENKVCGHYRVLTTAISFRIGCAMNTCNKFSVSSYPTPAIFFSCSYNGRYLIYDKPYTVGQRGSDCTLAKQSVDFQYYRYGLCITPDLYFDNSGFDGNTSIVGLPSDYLTTATTTSPTFSSSTLNTTDSLETLTTTTQEYTATDKYITSSEETTTEELVTTTVTTATTKSTTSHSTTTAERTDKQANITTLATTPKADSSTTLSTPITDSSTTLSTPVTDKSTTSSTPITDSSTTLSPPSTDNFTSLSSQSTAILTTSSKEGSTTFSTQSQESSSKLLTQSTGSSTETEIVTSLYPSTSTKHTSSKKTVSHATRPCLWNFQHVLLLPLVCILASFDGVF